MSAPKLSDDASRANRPIRRKYELHTATEAFAHGTRNQEIARILRELAGRFEHRLFDGYARLQASDGRPCGKAVDLEAKYMDPNVSLQEQEVILRARRRGDPDEGTARLAELGAALSDWLANGGRQPHWETCPLAARHYGWR